MVICITGVVIYGGQRASASLNVPEAHSFHHEYGSLACTVEIVDDVYAAIDHIHQHGRLYILVYMFCSPLLGLFVWLSCHYAGQ